MANEPSAASGTGVWPCTIPFTSGCRNSEPARRAGRVATPSVPFTAYLVLLRRFCEVIRIVAPTCRISGVDWTGDRFSDPVGTRAVSTVVRWTGGIVTEYRPSALVATVVTVR